MRGALKLLLAAVVLAVIVMLFVIPARTFVSQSHSLALTQRQVSDLATENAKLKAEATSLQSKAKIEQIARADYGLVMPGQKAYAIIPPAASTTPAHPKKSPTSTTTVSPTTVPSVTTPTTTAG